MAITVLKYLCQDLACNIRKRDGWVDAIVLDQMLDGLRFQSNRLTHLENLSIGTLQRDLLWSRHSRSIDRGRKQTLELINERENGWVFCSSKSENFKEERDTINRRFIVTTHPFCCNSKFYHTPNRFKFFAFYASPTPLFYFLFFNILLQKPFYYFI